MKPVSFKCGDMSAKLYGEHVTLVHHYISTYGERRVSNVIPVTSVEHALVALQRAKEYAKLCGDIAAV